MTKHKQLLQMVLLMLVHFDPGPSFIHFGNLVAGCLAPAVVPLPDGPASFSWLPLGVVSIETCGWYCGVIG